MHEKSREVLTYDLILYIEKRILMDWINRMNSSIDYIEENLAGIIDFERAAQIAGCSVYNFQRMFSFILDKPLSEYIRSRRLTLAAFELQHSNMKIIDVALKYGYDSHDSFTRAFQRFHGVVPSLARDKGTKLKSCPRISFQISIRGDKQMNYQIEDFEEFSIVGFKKRVNTATAFEEIPKIWDTASKNGDMNSLFKMLTAADSRPAGLLGICVGGNWGNSEEFDYYLGVTTNIEPADNMAKFDFPKATWVIFDASGKLPDAVQEVHKRFYTEWLPNSGYEPDDLPTIECYMQNNRQEVWVAIVKK